MHEGKVVRARLSRFAQEDNSSVRGVFGGLGTRSRWVPAGAADVGDFGAAGVPEARR